VTKLEGLHTLNFNQAVSRKDSEVSKTMNDEEKFIVVSDKVKEEMSRLRRMRSLQLCYQPINRLPHEQMKVIFHNVWSLHSHFDNLVADPNFMSAEVIAVAESKLYPNELDEKYTTDSYSMIRCDQLHLTGNQCLPHGIVIYYKDENLTLIDLTRI